MENQMFYYSDGFKLAVCTIILLGVLCALVGFMGLNSPHRANGWKYQLVQVTAFFGGSAMISLLSLTSTDVESTGFPVILIGSFTASMVCFGITHRVCRLRAEQQIQDQRRIQIARANFLREDYNPTVTVDNSEWLHGRWKHQTEESRKN